MSFLKKNVKKERSTYLRKDEDEIPDQTVPGEDFITFLVYLLSATLAYFIKRNLNKMLLLIPIIRYFMFLT